MKIPFASQSVRVTSPYGMRGAEFHKGLDLVGVDSLNVVAVEDATVGMSTIVTDRSNATWEWGNYVRLDLADGKRLYHCHLQSRAVSTGQRVKKGDLLGICGQTGNATGTHLHWELRPAGTGHDSLDVAAWSGIPNAKGTYSDESPTPTPTPTPSSGFSVGDTVFLKEGAVYTNGVKVPNKYIGLPYTVQQVLPGKVLIRELYSWVAEEYVSPYVAAKAPTGVVSVGGRVQILPGAVYSNSKGVPSRYIGKIFTVQKILPGKVLIQELYSWVKSEYVKAV